MKPPTESARHAFIAEHRGGPLTQEQHRLLMRWARACITRVLPLAGEPLDARLAGAFAVAEAWETGAATVGAARKAAVGAIAVANEQTDPARIAFARGVGHMVATAHMADHAPGAAEYALKALAAAGLPFDTERAWQDEQLPDAIRELVLSDRERKAWFWQKQRDNARKRGA